MASLEIQLDSAVPINDQIVSGLRRAIATGALQPRDELPPVRQLAADLGVNLNTVARAYRALESQGLVSTVRGRGTRVTAATEQRVAAPDAVVTKITIGLSDAIADAKLAGLNRAAVTKALDKIIAAYFDQPSHANRGRSR